LISILMSVSDSLLKFTWDLTISGASTRAYQKMMIENYANVSKSNT